jgi:transposase-like protein
VDPKNWTKKIVKKDDKLVKNKGVFMKMKKQFTAEFKAKVALVLISGKQTLGQVCSHYKVSSSAAMRWKEQLMERANLAFSNDSNKKMQEVEKKEEELYSQIGKLQMQVDYLKKLSL